MVTMKHFAAETWPAEASENDRTASKLAVVGMMFTGDGDTSWCYFYSDKI